MQFCSPGSAIMECADAVEPHGQARGPLKSRSDFGDRIPDTLRVSRDTIKHPTMWGDIPPTHTRKHSRWGPRPRPWPDGGVDESSCTWLGSLSGNHALQKDNFLVYTIDLEINLLELNTAYPKEPKTLGEYIRKARMDRGLLIRELAALIGVSPDTVINWELRGVNPTGRSLRRLQEVLEVEAPEAWRG